jgi:hypothetical protein
MQIRGQESDSIVCCDVGEDCRERRFAGKHLHGVQPAGEIMPDPFDCYLSSPVIWMGAV